MFVCMNWRNNEARAHGLDLRIHTNVYGIGSVEIWQTRRKNFPREYADIFKEYATRSRGLTREPQVKRRLDFYGATLCQRDICRRRVSVCVCVSVTLQYCIKTAKRMITQITPHDSPVTTFLTPKITNSINPYGAKNVSEWGGLKSTTFDERRAITRR